MLSNSMQALFTIVAKHTHGLGQRPLGVGVGGEAPMIHSKSSLVIWILEVQVEIPKRCRLQHALHGQDSAMSQYNEHPAASLL